MPARKVNFELQPWTFPGGPRAHELRLPPRRACGSCNNSSGTLGSLLRDGGYKEAEAFSREVCFDSVGISGQGAPTLALVEGSGKDSRRCCCSGRSFQRSWFSTVLPSEVAPKKLGFSTSWS